MPKRNARPGVPTATRPKLFSYGLALLALAVITCLIGLLGHSARLDQPTDFDHEVHAAIVKHRPDHPELTQLMLWLTELGNPPFATAATLAVGLGLYTLHRRSIAGVRRSEVILWLFTILGAWSLGRGLKILFKRERPPLDHRLVVENSYSFPSGHSVFAGVFYTLLAILLARLVPTTYPWLRRLVVTSCLTAAIAIALSRVWLGVHYPTDVLAGLLIGSSTSAGVWLVRIGLSHPAEDPEDDHFPQPPATIQPRASGG